MELNLVKTPDGWMLPADDEGIESVSHLAAGEVLRCKATKMRNGKFHRKFFKLMHVVFENQDKYKTFKDFMVEIKLKAGLYEEHVTLRGNLIYVPQSISFAKMDELDFRKFYSRVTTIVMRDFYNGDISEAALNQEVHRRLSFC